MNVLTVSAAKLQGALFADVMRARAFGQSTLPEKRNEGAPWEDIALGEWGQVL